MSLYALNRETIKGLSREYWGRKIKVPTKFNPQTGEPTEFEYYDTGVQPAIAELLARMSSINPLLGTVTIQAPENGFAMRLLSGGNRGDGQNSGGIEIVNTTTGGTTVINPPASGGTPDPTTGFTGSITVSGAPISVNVSGCDVTVSGSTITLDFQNGRLVNAVTT